MSNSTGPSRWLPRDDLRLRVRQWSVLFVGLTLLFSSFWHYGLEDVNQVSTLVETTTVTFLSLSVVAIGVELGRNHADAAQVSTALRFCLVGGVVALALGGWIVLGLEAQQAGVQDVSFVALSMMAAGASAGTFFGVNYDRLRQRTAALVDRDNRLDEFVGIVGHDLRNPLTTAKGHLEQARRTGEDRHFEAVEEAHEQMERLVREIGGLATDPDDSIQAEELEPVRPVGVRRVAEDVWAGLETHEADLRVAFPGTIAVEERRLRSLFRNLFRNAIEHGGEHVTVTVGGLDDGFYVEDDGRGIPKEERELVWRGGYTTEAENRGFGLSIVRRIAEVHGWRMKIVTGRSGGARVEFTDVGRPELEADGSGYPVSLFPFGGRE